jgi:hypothetical protein
MARQAVPTARASNQDESMQRLGSSELGSRLVAQPGS